MSGLTLRTAGLGAGQRGPTWARVAKARPRVRAKEAGGGGSADGSPHPGFESSRQPRRAETLTPVADPLRKPPADKPTDECRPGSGSRLRAPGRSFLPGRGGSPRGLAGAGAHPGRFLLSRSSAQDRAAPERRTKGRAGRVRCPAPSTGLPVPTATFLTRNRGPHSPSPAGVHGTPAPLMMRTVGREAPASAPAQRRGARTAHC